MGCSSARGTGGLEQPQLTLEPQQRDEDGSENAREKIHPTCVRVSLKSRQCGIPTNSSRLFI